MPDNIQRFLFADVSVRGAIVRLETSFQTIIAQHHYPDAIAGLLGEALLATVLMTNTIKFEGQLTVQFQGEGPLELLVAKCDHNNHIRGLAQWSSDALAGDVVSSISDGSLVVTIDPYKKVQPYQSVVPVENRTISGALEHYFNLSEQLATRFWLQVVDGQAFGMMLQAVPPESVEDFCDVVLEAQINLKKQDVAENNATLLQNIFSRSIQLFDEAPVEFRCTCTLERMEDAVRTFGEEEARDILLTSKEVVVTCEYCNHEYGFSTSDIDHIFSSGV
jgi:molecular chaperone Hsp33